VTVAAYSRPSEHERIIFTSVASKSVRRSPEACARRNQPGDHRTHPVPGVADLLAVVGAEHHQLRQREVVGHGGGGELEVGDKTLQGSGGPRTPVRHRDERVDPLAEQLAMSDSLSGKRR